MGCGGVSHLQVVWLPAWHTVYSSGKYEVSRGVFSPFGFLCLQGFFVPSLIWKPAAVHIFLLNTLCTLRLFSVYVCETLFYCAFFVRNSFFALSLRENCLVARCFRKLTYKVLVIQCIIIRRCIFGRFICICRLVCGVTEEWICC